nr:rhodanese-like domain-containing protein [uncultured Desulfuromonas sp.]
MAVIAVQERGCVAMEDAVDQVLQRMTLDFVGQSRHKISPAALFATDDAVLLDIRTEPEQLTLPLGFVYHAQVIHLPLDQLPSRFSELPQGRPIGIFCPHGVRAAMSYLYLQAKGYEQVFVLDGGYEALAEEARPGNVLKRCSQSSQQV